MKSKEEILELLESNGGSMDDTELVTVLSGDSFEERSIYNIKLKSMIDEGLIEYDRYEEEYHIN